MKKLLITGASGFVGSHLTEAAKAQGYHIYSLVRRSSDTSLLQKLDIQLLEADLTDLPTLEQVFKKLQNQGVQFDQVVHAAAVTNAPDWETFEKVNVKGTANFLNVLQRFNPSIEQFIFISSLAASGPTIGNRLIKKEHQAPITNYGRSKLAAEKIVKESNIPYLIFRPTAVYGPREKDLLTVFKIINKGWNLSIGNHPQKLTFVHVKDLVNLILNSLAQKNIHQTFFVSDGQVYKKEAFAEHIYRSLQKKPISLTIPLWLVKIIAALSGAIAKLQNKSSPLNLEKYQELKAESWACDVSPTFSALNFQPAYDLKRGVEETVQWYLKNNWI